MIGIQSVATTKRVQLFVALICALLVCRSLLADNVVFESGPKKVQLLELFTSEGCSSCPPAEASLGRLVDDPRLWRQFVPVAFHVDYWDHLGWKDPFASPEWTTRQRAYAANWNADSVYTPAFVLNGREWRSATVPAAEGEAAGVLKIAARNDETVLGRQLFGIRPVLGGILQHGLDGLHQALGLDVSGIVVARVGFDCGWGGGRGA